MTSTYVSKRLAGEPRQGRPTLLLASQDDGIGHSAIPESMPEYRVGGGGDALRTTNSRVVESKPLLPSYQLQGGGQSSSTAQVDVNSDFNVNALKGCVNTTVIKSTLHILTKGI